MICTKCGREIEPGRRFCRFCGVPVEDGAPAPLADTQAMMPVFEPERPGRDRDLSAILLIAFAVVVCAVLATVLYFVLRPDGAESTAGHLEVSAGITLGPEDTADGDDATDVGGATGGGGVGTGDGGDIGGAGEPGGPTTTAAGPLVDLCAHATLRASSTLAVQGAVDYGPINLVDNDPATCWAEGVPGYGVGEYVEFTFSSPVTVTEISIVPGYDKTTDGWDRWWSNGRVGSFRLSFSDGTVESYSITDTREPQSITLGSPHTVTSMRFTITGVYQAEEGPDKAEDTSVSELYVWGRE